MFRRLSGLAAIVAGSAALGLVFAVSPAFADVTCTGTQSKNVSGNLVVPAGKTCTIKAVKISGNVTVDSGATLIDQGAIIGGNITATSPKGIGIGGTASGPGSVENITITGLSGQGPGLVHPGDNYICNTNLTHQGNLQITGTLSAAGAWIIGDIDEECTNGGNQITGNVLVQNNQDRVDISDNEKGPFPYTVGIFQNLTVTGNTVTSTSPIVESNDIGGSATCQAGTKKDADGSPNIVGGTNHGCP